MNSTSRGRATAVVVAGFLLIGAARGRCRARVGRQRACSCPYGSSFNYMQVAHDALPGFEQPAFDDSSWSVGTAPFGSSDVCGDTFATNWDTNSDILLRKVLAVPPGARNVVVHAKIDNDLIVYLNGRDVSGGVHQHENCPTRDDVGPFAVYGYAGNDTLAGLGGNDTLRPGVGDDPSVDGGTGIDTLSYSDITVNVAVSRLLGGGVDVDLAGGSVTGVGGNDTISTLFHSVVGSPQDDTLSARFATPLADQSSVLYGGAGDDTLDIQDGRGKDIANGGDGADTCTADSTDTLRTCP